MKKILMVFCLFIGLFSLASCENEATTITIIDENGNKTNVEIVATDDIETVQAVLDFASSSKYEDVTCLTIANSMDLKVKFSKELASLMQLQSTQLTAELNNSLKVNKEMGIEASLSAKLHVDDANNAKASASLIYNGKLEDLINETSRAYIDASYEYKSASTSANFGQKIAVNPMELFGSLEDQLPNLPEFPPVDEPIEERVSLTEFYETFPNSKIYISSVQRHKITICTEISYKDVVSQFDLDPKDYAFLQSYINLDNSIKMHYEIDAQEGKLHHISVVFNDVALVNFILLNFLSIQIAPTTPLIESFEFSSRIDLYETAEIKTLSSTEKSQYTFQSFGE